MDDDHCLLCGKYFGDDDDNWPFCSERCVEFWNKEEHEIAIYEEIKRDGGYYDEPI